MSAEPREPDDLDRYEATLPQAERDWLDLVREASCHQTPEIQAAWQALKESRWKRVKRFFLYGLKGLPEDTWYSVKRFWQRGRRGWSDQDMWGFDYYLAEVIAGGVSRIAAWEHGYKEGYGGEEGWQRILEELAEGFAHYSADDSCDLECPKVQRSLELFTELFPKLWI